MADGVNQEEDQIETDPLFYGLTVPANLRGVPTYMIPVILGTATIAVVVTQNPIWFVSIVPLTLVVYFLCERDIHFFSRAWLFVRTKLTTPNKHIWRGSSYSPTGRFRRTVMPRNRDIYDEF